MFKKRFLSKSPLSEEQVENIQIQKHCIIQQSKINIRSFFFNFLTTLSLKRIKRIEHVCNCYTCLLQLRTITFDTISPLFYITVLSNRFFYENRWFKVKTIKKY